MRSEGQMPPREMKLKEQTAFEELPPQAELVSPCPEQLALLQPVPLPPAPEPPKMPIKMADAGVGGDSPLMAAPTTPPAAVPLCGHEAFGGGAEDVEHPLIITPPAAAVTTEMGQQTTPDKLPLVPRTRKRPYDPLRPPRQGRYQLVEVGLEAFGAGNGARTRPRRHIIPPLEHWRGEQVVYERLPGSWLPTVARVVLAQNLQEPEEDEKKPPMLPIEFSPEARPSPDSSHEDFIPEEDDPSPSPDGFNKVGGGKGKAGKSGKGPARGGRRAGGTRVAGPGKATGQRSRAAKRLPEVLADEAPAAEVPTEAPEQKKAVPKKRAKKVAPNDAAQQDDEGFCLVPVAPGSVSACAIRVGIDNGYTLCCDIRIPPQSFNAPETVAPGKGLIIFVTSAETGKLSIDYGDGNVKTLDAGDNALICPEMTYCLRNLSQTTRACMKLVLVSR